MKKAKNKNPLQKFYNRKWGLILFAVVVIIGLAFIGRGWIRMTAEPKTVSVFYNSNVKRIRDAEYGKLQSPLALLGYSTPYTQHTGCQTTLAQSIHTLVSCTYSYNSFKQTSQDAQAKASLNADAAKLQGLLQKNGWSGQYTDTGQYTSLTKLVSSITSGIDYQPDAAYQKNIGKVFCLFDSNTAFSRPNPPAIASQFTCSRDVNFLGKPSFTPKQLY